MNRMEPSAEQPQFEFTIDKLAHDLPPVKNQRDWQQARTQGQESFASNSIFNLIPEEGKFGLQAVVFKMLRSGINQIHQLAIKSDIELRENLTDRFGRKPTEDEWEIIDLLREKVLELSRKGEIRLPN